MAATIDLGNLNTACHTACIRHAGVYVSTHVVMIHQISGHCKHYNIWWSWNPIYVLFLSLELTHLVAMLRGKSGSSHVPWLGTSFMHKGQR